MIVKLGLRKGNKHAMEQGITTQTEALVEGGAKTNPQLRLSSKEQEYVLGQLMQKNYDIRSGQSVFKSKTGRTTLGGNSLFQAPPVGLYEHKFNKGKTHNTSCHNKTIQKSTEKQSETKKQKAEIAQNLISKPHEKLANTQAFSCLAETREVDFTMS